MWPDCCFLCHWVGEKRVWSSSNPTLVLTLAYQFGSLASQTLLPESRSGESGPKLVTKRNALIAYIIMLFDHRCGLFPQFENVMTLLSNKCCNLIGLPKFQPSSQKVIQIPQTLPRGRLLKAISPAQKRVWLARLLIWWC